jgi:hypothetical protein
MRNKWPARVLTFRAPRHSSFPPLMRHRQTKEPVSARPHLHRRATPRLHLIDRGLGEIIPGFFVCIDPSKLRRA